MEAETMGRVFTEATIESLKDLWDAERGLISADHVRRVRVPNALVDSSTKLIALPSCVIHRLGLEAQNQKAAMYDPVRLTIQGRDCTMDVVEVPDGTPVLIGRLPLLRLDLVVDWESHSLAGNPAHGGEQILEL